MSELQDNIWVLLAKHLCGEATSAERVLVDNLLAENSDLQLFYKKLESAYLVADESGKREASKAFAHLDARIKKS